MGDVTLRMGERGDEIITHSTETDWEITFAETGVETNTGGRIKRAAKYIGDAETFMRGPWTVNRTRWRRCRSGYPSR